MRGQSNRRLASNPPPSDHRNFAAVAAASRDSDASFASSRPSSIGIGRPSSVDLYVDRNHQASAVRSINTYLSSHSSLNPLPKPNHVPSIKDIIDTLKFLISRLEYPCTKLEDDLFVILKTLNCPFKVNKSTLRAPNTPHNWPNYLALIHWLVQIASYHDHLSSNPRSFVENNSMYMYALDSYLNYIRGDDDSVEALDTECIGKLEREKESLGESVSELERNAAELEAKVEGLRTGPTQREALEKERSVLEEDVKKFHAMIGEFAGRVTVMEKVLEEKERELGTKKEENARICEENEELKKRVDLQTFNSRDVERMRRELQAVERDIAEAEAARNSWEEKSWDLDATIGQKFKELESLSMECNQAIRRLKLGNGLLYALSAKGSTPAEVMGIDYKSTLKPALESFGDDIKKSSMAKLEELISLQQQSSEVASRIEGKRNQIASLQSHIDEVEARLNLLKKETQDYIYRCAAEAKRLMDDVQMEAQNLDVVDREAAEILKASKMKLQEAIRETEDEIQLHANELFKLVDSVAKYKEYMESKISQMRVDLSKTAVAISDVCKGSLPIQLGLTMEDFSTI